MSLPAGAITDLDVTRPESRGGNVLPTCWVRETNSPTTRDGTPALVPIHRCTPALPQAGADDAVLVLLGPGSPEAARAFIQSAASANARVYVLAQHSELDEAAASAVLGQAGARVLIRRVAALAVSGILVDRGRAGGLFLAASPEVAPAWWLPLTEEQGSAAFRYALHEFWHQATDEGWAEGSRVRFNQARERPFDVPLPPRHAPVRPVSDPPKGARWCWYSPGGDLPAGKPPERVVVHPSGEHHAALAKLARARSQVIWSDIGLPPAALDEHAGIVLSGASSHRLQIELGPDQVAAIRHLVDEASAAPGWRFVTDVRLADLDGPVLLPGAAEASPVIDDHPGRCDPVAAGSLRAMPDTEPSSFPELAPLVRGVRWTWTVRPPRAPKAAKQAPLSAAWNKLDADVKSRLGRAQEQLSELEQRSGALGRAFDALAGALLGFGRTRTSLARRVTELAGKTPSALGPAGATSMLDEIHQVETQLGDLVGNVDQAEHTAKMEKERAEQLAAFEESKRHAERDTTQHQTELQELRQALQAAEAGLGELAGDSHGLSKKDRRARQKKLRDDSKSAERRSSRLEQLIADAQSVLDSEFSFRPSPVPTAQKKSGKVAGGARFVPKARPNPITTPPDEAPPSVGELLSRDGQRYLVLTRWKQLDEGEAEADRLGAKLVAPAEGR